MKRILLIAVALFTMTTMGASVEWGAFQLFGNSPGSIILGYDGSEVYANTSVSMMTTKNGNALNIAEEGTYLAAFTAWTVAIAGEIVNADMLRDVDRLFYRCDGIQANNPFDVDYVSDSFYFAFETLVWDNPELSGSRQVEYGWVQIEVTNGALAVIDSAMGLEGQSMIVGAGAIPEPSSGTMLVWGIVLLSLRRSPRRFVG